MEVHWCSSQIEGWKILIDLQIKKNLDLGISLHVFRVVDIHHILVVDLESQSCSHDYNDININFDRGILEEENFGVTE